MFITIAGNTLGYSDFAQKYKIINNDLCLKIQDACDFIRKNKIHLIEQFLDNKKVFKISKTNPTNLSIYLAKNCSGEIHFFINLGKKISFNNEGHHKQLSHAIKYNDESIEKWVLAKTPLKDNLKKMMAKKESQFLCMFPNSEEIMQTDLFETLSTKLIDKQYIFMPLCEFGSLEQALINKRTFSNKECQQLFLDIANAVAIMHKSNVVYRDLKPENILLYEKENQLRAKLTDFGLSNELREDVIFNLSASPYIFSPEMLELRAANKTEIKREDIKPCDIWALGLTFYRILYRVIPYEEAYKASRQIKDHHKFKIAIEEWLATYFPEPNNKASIEYLIYEMLSIDPQKRPDIEQVVNRLKNND